MEKVLLKSIDKHDDLYFHLGKIYEATLGMDEGFEVYEVITELGEECLFTLELDDYGFSYKDFFEIVEDYLA